MTDLEWEISDQLEVTRSYMTQDSLICNALASTHKLLELFFEYLQEFKQLQSNQAVKKKSVSKKAPRKRASKKGDD